jgi:hypothetical protein
MCADARVQACMAAKARLFHANKCSCRTTEGAVGTGCPKNSLEGLNKDGPDVPMSWDTC